MRHPVLYIAKELGSGTRCRGPSQKNYPLYKMYLKIRNPEISIPVSIKVRNIYINKSITQVEYEGNYRYRTLSLV
jgi:hypothetical protein